QITRIAEIVADRHIKGGLLGFPWNSQSLQQEIAGRAGGLMNIDFARPWANRNPADDKYNVAIIGWDRAPAADEAAKLQKLKDAGTFILGFGPKDLPALAEEVKVCDAFIDTGLGADDRVVTLPNGEKVGQGNELVNMLNGWAFTGEFIAALTRKGKMPPIWKAFMYPDGREWMEKYFGKIQFHDPKEFPVPPIAPGVITRDFLNKIRANISWFQSTQNVRVNEAAYLIANDLNVERKTIVSAMGHAPWTFVGKYEDARWCDPYELDSGDSVHIENYKKTPVGALVLRLGYGGLDDKAAAIYAAKDQRVIMVSSPDPRPDSQSKVGVILDIDMGWKYGDALVSIPNYPIKLIPPSGIMQVVAYECINTEVLARLPKSTP
ncbi:MAG: hypothetical protein ABI210_05765, partial [Abditibacteriaceae bacterium]